MSRLICLNYLNTSYIGNVEIMAFIIKFFVHFEDLQFHLNYSSEEISSFLKQYRGSYMSAHVLLNLLNKFGKSDKMCGLLTILSLFHEFNKFNNTGA